METPSGDSFDQQGVFDLEIQDFADLLSVLVHDIVELLGLDQSSGESVQKDAFY